MLDLVRDREAVREEVHTRLLEQHVPDDRGPGLVDVQVMRLEDVDLTATSELGGRTLLRPRRVRVVRLADREPDIPRRRVLEPDARHQAATRCRSRSQLTIASAARSDA